MRKIFYIFLVFSLLLAGCSVNNQTEMPENTEPSQAEVIATEPTETVPEEVQVPFVSLDITSDDVLYDDNNIKITVIEASKVNWGTQFQVHIQNNSDKNIMFTGNDFLANGFIRMQGGWKINVQANSETIQFINFSVNRFNTQSINISSLDGLDCGIYDVDSEELLYEVPFNITTGSQEKYSFDSITELNELLLIEKDGLEIWAYGYLKTGSFQAIQLLVKNDTDKNILFEGTEISLNRSRVKLENSDFSYKTQAKTLQYYDVYISLDELLSNEIDYINKFRTTLSVYDEDSGELLLEEYISVDPHKLEKYTME